jgi:TPR repeat protein
VLYFALATILLGTLLWDIWLWGSVTESGYVSHVAMRIIAVTLLCALAGGSLLPLVPGSVRTVMIQALTRADSNLASVQMFGTFGGPPVSEAAQTYALLVDAIPRDVDDEGLILDRITKLGADSETRVILRGKDCTLKEFARTFSAFRLKLRSQDRFIVYIHGHGAQNGAGSIRIEDGEITSMSLRSLLTDLPTSHCLVIIDSCFGGKFLDRLRGCDAVILASTDDQDVSFSSGLRPFWEALGKPGADRDGDAQVTVKEAFWWAYRTMLRNGETARQVGMERLPGEKALLDKAGYATPQLEAMGKASEDDFAITVTPLAFSRVGSRTEVAAAQRRPASRPAALEELLKRADEDDATAMFYLGLRYHTGQGLSRDDKKAVAWYRKAAERGNAMAMCNLAAMCADGQGVPKDEKQAVEWFRKSAELGQPEAMLGLCVLYQHGRGVPKDEKQAVNWCQKSADLGNTDAMCTLGVMYANGEGVPKDEKQAVKWYRKGAELGNADAILSLASRYNQGRGVPQDGKQAVQWYRKAAELGRADAMLNLGAIFDNGHGVPADTVRAYMWLSLSVAKGDKYAQARLAILAKRMTPAQIQEANRLAREWRMEHQQN